MCKVWITSFRRLLGMTQLTLISEVLTMLMLMPSSEMASNILAATPGLLTIPAPTMETLTSPVSEVVSR
ncbi:hypothetical protein D3C81_2047180 [compost metagenome]